MPEKIALKLQENKKNYFTSYNIGLIAVDQNKYTILIKPKLNNNNYSNSMLISSTAKYLLLQNQVI